MPDQVNPEFQQALKDAIQSFKNTKTPLWKHHLDHIAIINGIVNNSRQTNRQMHDRVVKACREINLKLWNWLGGSLLVENLLAVLQDPRFDVEKMYEAVIDKKEEIIGVQRGRITQLEEENNKFKEDPEWYAKELRAKLNQQDQVIVKALEQQKLTEEKLDECTKLLQTVAAKLNSHEKGDQVLEDQLKKYGKEDSAKKQFNIPTSKGNGDRSKFFVENESDTHSVSSRISVG